MKLHSVRSRIRQIRYQIHDIRLEKSMITKNDPALSNLYSTLPNNIVFGQIYSYNRYRVFRS